MQIMIMRPNWGFLKSGYPQIIPFNEMLPEINHLFWGTFISGNPQIWPNQQTSINPWFIKLWLINVSLKLCQSTMLLALHRALQPRSKASGLVPCGSQCTMHDISIRARRGRCVWRASIRYTSVPWAECGSGRRVHQKMIEKHAFYFLGGYIHELSRMRLIWFWNP